MKIAKRSVVSHAASCLFGALVALVCCYQYWWIFPSVKYWLYPPAKNETVAVSHAQQSYSWDMIEADYTWQIEYGDDGDLKHKALAKMADLFARSPDDFHLEVYVQRGCPTPCYLLHFHFQEKERVETHKIIARHHTTVRFVSPQDRMIVAK